MSILSARTTMKKQRSTLVRLLAAAGICLALSPVLAEANPGNGHGNPHWDNQQGNNDHGGRWDRDDRWDHHDRDRHHWKEERRTVVIHREEPRRDFGRRVVYRDRVYYVRDNHFYRHHDGRYRVVNAPLGELMLNLPSAAVRVSVGGQPYYRYHDRYYWYDSFSSGFRLVLDM
ncbi:DUF6515 family protein [Pokkaliibacter sp. CJK22405]|uniref:DUF6515 family protein n=1 Tax=Pokkaliibacter sp. CJK22405 TaxID=3384615 RepID=UPI0039851A84